MSPVGPSGRGAATLTPVPNWTKVFFIARRTRCIAEARTTESWPKETYYFFPKGIERGA